MKIFFIFLCTNFLCRDLLISAHVCVGNFIQVAYSCASNTGNISDNPQKKADCGNHTGNPVHCGCQETERIRCLPGLSHVTYGWMPMGCGRSFLEVSYAYSPSISEHGAENERSTNGSDESHTGIEKFVTNGCVPLKKCNKWPCHSSLTLICDSRPSHTVVRVRAKKNLQKCDKNCTSKSNPVRSDCTKSV